MKLSDVNWLPWSVLQISGVPYFCSASSRVSMQKESSRVFGYPPDNTFLLAQSMEATRLQKPFAMGMQVIYRDTTRNLLR